MAMGLPWDFCFFWAIAPWARRRFRPCRARRGRVSPRPAQVPSLRSFCFLCFFSGFDVVVDFISGEERMRGMLPCVAEGWACPFSPVELWLVWVAGDSFGFVLGGAGFVLRVVDFVDDAGLLPVFVSNEELRCVPEGFLFGWRGLGLFFPRLILMTTSPICFQRSDASWPSAGALDLAASSMFGGRRQD